MRSICGALTLMVAVTSLGLASPRVAAAGGPGVTVVASLDGKVIPLREVANYYCDDFAFPVITCSVNAAGMETRASATLLAAGVEFVTIYDAPLYGGAWMNVSQDYSGLWSIGWNDRVSSFKARNSETGRFFTDWFYSGTIYGFCCNQQLASLGAYDNTFSSIQRT
jgi:hypothetical protein